MFAARAPRPADRDTLAALRLVAEVVGVSSAYQLDGAFYFELGGPWLLRLSPDAGDRFRVSACIGTAEVDTLWSLASDLRRLAALTGSLIAEIQAHSARRG